MYFHLIMSNYDNSFLMQPVYPGHRLIPCEEEEIDFDRIPEVPAELQTTANTLMERLEYVSMLVEISAYQGSAKSQKDKVEPAHKA